MWCSLAGNVFLSSCSCPPHDDGEEDGYVADDGDGDDDDNDDDGDGVRQQVMSS